MANIDATEYYWMLTSEITYDSILETDAVLR